jgi:TP901 family phage tail tape measure protein
MAVIDTAYISFRAQMDRSWGALQQRLGNVFNSISKAAREATDVLGGGAGPIMDLRGAYQKLGDASTITKERLDTVRMGGEGVRHFLQNARTDLNKYRTSQRGAAKEEARHKDQLDKLKVSHRQLTSDLVRHRKQSGNTREVMQWLSKDFQITSEMSRRFTQDIGAHRKEERTLQTQIGRVSEAIKRREGAMKEAQKEQETYGKRITEVKDAMGDVTAAHLKLLRLPFFATKIATSALVVLTGMFVGLAAAAGSLTYQMAEVATMLNRRTIPALESLTNTVVNVSNEFGAASKDISKALYQILSAQVGVGESSEVLRVATETARAGFVSVGIAADALTTIMNAYGMSSMDVGKISDQLFMTVRKGKTTFAELGSQIGRVAAQGSLAKVATEDLFSAIAVMTQAGIKSSVTMTSLTAMLRNLLSPSMDATALAASKFGVQLGSAGLEAQGLIGIMRGLAGATAEEIRMIFASQRAFRGAAALLENINGYMKTYADMTDSAGTRVEALAQVQGTLTYQIQRTGEAVKNFTAQVGRAMDANKTLASVVKDVADVMADLVEFFQTAQGQQVALGILIGGVTAAVIALGVAISGVLVALSVILPMLGAVGVTLGGVAVTIAGVVGSLFVLTGVIGVVITKYLKAKKQQRELSGKALIDRLGNEIQARKEATKIIEKQLNALEELRKEEEAILHVQDNLGDNLDEDVRRRKERSIALSLELNRTRQLRATVIALQEQQKLGIELNETLLGGIHDLSRAREQLGKATEETAEIERKLLLARAASARMEAGYKMAAARRARSKGEYKKWLELLKEGLELKATAVQLQQDLNRAKEEGAKKEGEAVGWAGESYETLESKFWDIIKATEKGETLGSKNWKNQIKNAEQYSKAVTTSWSAQIQALQAYLDLNPELNAENKRIIEQYKAQFEARSKIVETAAGFLPALRQMKDLSEGEAQAIADELRGIIDMKGEEWEIVKAMQAQIYYQSELKSLQEETSGLKERKGIMSETIQAMRDSASISEEGAKYLEFRAEQAAKLAELENRRKELELKIKQAQQKDDKDREKALKARLYLTKVALANQKRVTWETYQQVKNMEDQDELQDRWGALRVKNMMRRGIQMGPAAVSFGKGPEKETAKNTGLGVKELKNIGGKFDTLIEIMLGRPIENATFGE